MSVDPTPKQEKLLKLIMENYGKPGETKSLGSLMIEAGYSEESSKNPKLILQSEYLKDKLDDWAKMLDDKRRMAITQITEEKLVKSSARDLAQIVTTLNKDFQLVSGGATERTENVLTKEQLDEILLRRSTQDNTDGEV
jgi:phosphoserine phosphatase